MLDGKSILITGGTGSFGKEFTKRFLKQYKPKRLVIYSRDELKQFEMSKNFSEEEYPAIRYFLGDIRDKDRLHRALEGIDYVVHAAALKQVPAAEYNPDEFIKTNILGAMNLIESCIQRGVKKVVALSTDKAAAPINLYGATKLCSDKLFIAANNFKGLKEIAFSVVRYGNVMGSRGSVIPFFLNQRHEGVITITDNKMTRFNISLKEGVDMVMKSLADSDYGEILIPKIPSYDILTLAEAIAPSCRIEEIGIRPGEKLHEEMITSSDSQNTVDLGNFYAITSASLVPDVDKYCSEINAKRVEEGFCYNSGTNKDFLSVTEIRDLIKEHVDPEFKPL